jgi:putative oxidoreductase
MDSVYSCAVDDRSFDSTNRSNEDQPMFLFRSPSNRQLSAGLAMLRIAVGIIFMLHGKQKLFGMGFAGVSGAFSHMGVPLPGIMGPFVGLLEFFGGIALILGLLTRLFALGFAIDMLVAWLLVLRPNGFSHYELEFLLCASSVALVFMGGGEFSIDSLFGRRKVKV